MCSDYNVFIEVLRFLEFGDDDSTLMSNVDKTIAFIGNNTWIIDMLLCSNTPRNRTPPGLWLMSKYFFFKFPDIVMKKY